MDRIQLETLLKENPAAMAAVQQMAAVKLQGKGKRKVKATTALTNKEHPSHKKAVSIFQKLKDKFSKKKEDEPKKQSQSDADFYKKQYAARTGKELEEGWWEDLSDKAQAAYKKLHPGSAQSGGGKSDDSGGKSKDVQDQEKRDSWQGKKSWLGIPVHDDGEPVDPDDIDDGGNLLPGKEDPENRSGGADPRRGSARTGKELTRKEIKQYIRRNKMKITEGILRKVIRSEIKKTLIEESSPGYTKREFGDPLPTFNDVKETHQNKIVKEDEDAFSQPIPATIERFMKKFIIAVNDKNLNRKRKLAILGRVIVALRLDPAEVSKYARLVKREL